MTVKECYDAIGGDYEEVSKHLRSEERIKRFLCKVPDDKSYMTLCDSLKQRNMEEAFRAAHSMKGICQNLALKKLGKFSSALTECLRNRREYTAEVEALFAQVQEDYAETMEGIRRL